MMKNSKKMSKKYMKALSNQFRGQGQVRLGLCSKLYRDGEVTTVPCCLINTLTIENVIKDTKLAISVKFSIIHVLKVKENL